WPTGWSATASSGKGAWTGSRTTCTPCRARRRRRMAASASTERPTVSGREIVLTRLLDAPRELVFDAFTRPEHLKEWWGPGGFTNTIQEMDVRPGGDFRLVMHGPAGRDYRNHMV